MVESERADPLRHQIIVVFSLSSTAQVVLAVEGGHSNYFIDCQLQLIPSVFGRQNSLASNALSVSQAASKLVQPHLAVVKTDITTNQVIEVA